MSRRGPRLHQLAVAALVTAAGCGATMEGAPDAGSDAAAPSGTIAAKTALVLRADPWRFEASGADPGAGWRDPGFDDSAWRSGFAVLGEGVAGADTDLQAAPGARTVYLRHRFDLPDDPSLIDTLALEAIYLHGFVAYLNGQEIARRGLPSGPIDATTPATWMDPMAATFPPVDVTGGRGALQRGANVLAVELHRPDPAPPDYIYAWDAALTFTARVDHVTRGPYLQRGAPTAMVIRWRTGAPTTGVVRFGLDPSQLAQQLAESAPATEHELSLTGLQPDTRYYYSVGTAAGALYGGDPETWFHTSPAPGTRRPYRVWVLGDSGSKDHHAREVRDAYYDGFAGRTATDLWLMLGDNAYQDGTDAEYQFAVFEQMYEALLTRAVLWPTSGNHDLVPYGDRAGFLANAPYFEEFTLPQAAEAGGAPSGTEAYYSFDYGNIHFVSLLYEDPPSEILPWLQADLAQNGQDWLVAFFHDPPYSKGSHDTDVDAARARVYAQYLEDGGVDLVLCGHSHGYERSFLIDGLYGTSLDFLADPARYTKDGGDGREPGSGAYHKPAGHVPHQGTVYVVAGSSSEIKGAEVATFDHPVMVQLGGRRGLAVYGSVLLDVNGPRLDARFADDRGAVQDSFTILKP